MTVPVVAEDEGQGCIAVSSVRPHGGGAPRMRLDRRCADRVIAQNRGPLVFRFRRMVFRAARNPEAQPVPPDQSTRLGLWVRESIPSCCASRRASDRRAERVGKGRRLVAVVRGEYSNEVIARGGSRGRHGWGAGLGANIHRNQATTGDAGRLSPQAKSPPSTCGRPPATGRACMACKRSGVRIPVAPLPSSKWQIRTAAAERLFDSRVCAIGRRGGQERK